MNSNKEDFEQSNSGTGDDKKPDSPGDIFSLDAIDDSWLDETDIFVRQKDGQVVKKNKPAPPPPPPAPKVRNSRTESLPPAPSKPPPQQVSTQQQAPTQQPPQQAPTQQPQQAPTQQPQQQAPTQQPQQQAPTQQPQQQAPTQQPQQEAPPTSPAILQKSASIPGVPKSRISPQFDLEVQENLVVSPKPQSGFDGDRSGFHYFVEKIDDMKLHGDYLEFGSRSQVGKNVAIEQSTEDASVTSEAAAVQTQAPAPAPAPAEAPAPASGPAPTPERESVPTQESGPGPIFDAQPAVPTVFSQGQSEKSESFAGKQMDEFLDEVDQVVRGSSEPTSSSSQSTSAAGPVISSGNSQVARSDRVPSLTPPPHSSPESGASLPEIASPESQKAGARPKLNSRLLSGESAGESAGKNSVSQNRISFKVLVLGLVLVGVVIGVGLFQLTRSNSGSSSTSSAQKDSKSIDANNNDKAAQGDSGDSLSERKLDRPIERWAKDFEKGLKYYDNKDYANAIVFFSTSIADDPSHFQVLHLRGKAYSRKKEFERAIEDFDKALKLKRNDANVLLDRAAAYIYTDKVKSAIRDYSTILKRDPENAKASYGRGLAYVALKKYSSAKKDFQSTIDSDPTYLNGYLQLGLLLAGDDKNDEAIDIFTRGLRIKRRADLYYERSLVYYARGDYQDAVNDLTAALKINPEKKEYLNDRGYIYLKLGKDGLAKADFQDALKIDPQYKLARENLARVN